MLAGLSIFYAGLWVLATLSWFVTHSKYPQVSFICAGLTWVILLIIGVSLL
jgi:hypothetical protein